jgi:hypothetical protein
MRRDAISNMPVAKETAIHGAKRIIAFIVREGKVGGQGRYQSFSDSIGKPTAGIAAAVWFQADARDLAATFAGTTCRVVRIIRRKKAPVVDGDVIERATKAAREAWRNGLITSGDVWPHVAKAVLEAAVPHSCGFDRKKTAASRTALPALIARCRALEAEVGRLTGELRQTNELAARDEERAEKAEALLKEERDCSAGIALCGECKAAEDEAIAEAKRRSKDQK